MKYIILIAALLFSSCAVADKTPTPTPKFKPGQHITMTVSGDPGIIVNTASYIKWPLEYMKAGWKYKVYLPEYKLHLLSVHASDLEAVAK